MMLAMEKLGRKKQISYPSTPDIVAKLNLAAAKVATMTSVGGNSLRTGHLVNAIALWISELPDDELRAFAVPKIRLLETYLGRSAPDDEDGPPPKRKNYRKVSADATAVGDLIPTAPPDTDTDEGEAGGEDAEPVPAKRNAPRARKS